MGKIKILHVLSALDCGGIENMLCGYYEILSKEGFEFDFIVHEEKRGMLEERLENLGGNIYHVTPKKKSIIKNFCDIYKIIHEGKYNIVHCHQNYSSFVALFAAFLCKIKIRIIHSHGAMNYNKFKHLILIFINCIFANYYFSCSLYSAISFYGKKILKNKNFFVMKNPIEIEKFLYKKINRKKIRNILKISDDCKVLIYVARFSKEKNHKFLISVLEKLISQGEFLLLFIGDGPNKKNIENIVEERRLVQHVVFINKTREVNKYLDASDYFLFPSKNEGLGIVGLEAQINGLNTLCSDKISKEITITDKIKFLPIDDCQIWVKEILDTHANHVLYKKEKFNEISIEACCIEYEKKIKSILSEEKL